VKITLTAREILDRGIWEEFCEMKGINVWAVNEGRMDTNEEFTFTEEEAYTLRILKRPDTGW
jgi:hypothetical protein